jgi:hypothetical protein
VALLVEVLLLLRVLLPLDVQQQGPVEVVVQQAQLHRVSMARSSSGRPGGRLDTGHSSLPSCSCMVTAAACFCCGSAFDAVHAG